MTQVQNLLSNIHSFVCDWALHKQMRRPIDAVLDRMINAHTQPYMTPKNQIFRPPSQPLPRPDEWRGVSEDPAQQQTNSPDLPTGSSSLQATENSQHNRSAGSDLTAQLTDAAESETPTDPMQQVSLDDILQSFLQQTGSTFALENGNLASDEKADPSTAQLSGDKLFLSSLADIPDEAVDNTRHLMAEWILQANQSGQTHTRILPRPRKKHIDAKRTVRNAARFAGKITRFSFRSSPTGIDSDIHSPHFLIIGDVSGSMGRYVTVVLSLLSTLDQLAKTDSYIFSDLPTYIQPLLSDEPFHVQYDRIRRDAHSWEYGTRLNYALQAVLHEHKYTQATHVILLTDGGFSLSGDDWWETVRRLSELGDCVRDMYVLTPNDALVAEGQACASQWVAVQSKLGDELNTGSLQKMARFGLLASKSKAILPCKTPDDVKQLLAQLTVTDGQRIYP